MIEVEVIAELTPTNPDCFGKGDNNVPECRCRLIFQQMKEGGHDDNQRTNPEA